jgi:hypothetical protein
MAEKSLTEMTDEEIIAEIQGLRERRAQARERRQVALSDKSKPKKEGPVEIGGELGSILDDIFAAGEPDEG